MNQTGDLPKIEALALVATIAGNSTEKINHSLTFLAIAKKDWYVSCFRGHC